jgi:transcriptional regulator with XRE-family HTH domain
MSRTPAKRGPVGETASAELRAARARRGLSQQQLADLLAARGHRIRRGAIATIETGDRRMDVDELLAFADVLGVTPLQLLGRAADGAFPEGYEVGWEACRNAMLAASYRTVPEGG